MSKWLEKFLEKGAQNSTDNTDGFASKSNMSVLSVPPIGPLDKNLGNIPETCTDSTDRFTPKSNMSVLSVPPTGLLDKNLGNMPETSTDSTDGFNSKTNMSVLSGSSLLDNFEERLAIAEYDGQQTQLQAKRIAYLDAFMGVLATLPYEEEEGYYDEDWLTRRVKATQHWLAAEGLQQPK